MKMRPRVGLILFLSLYLLGGIMRGTIAPPIYRTLNFSYKDIAISPVILFITQATGLMLFPVMNSLWFWIMAMIANVISVIVLATMTTQVDLWIFSIVVGISFYFYWTLWNIAYFTRTPKEKTGMGAAILFSVPSVLGVVAPLLAGFIPLSVLWILMIVPFIVAIGIVPLLPRISFRYSVRQIFTSIRPTRMLVFLEGFWDTITFSLIPIFALFFLHTPQTYGLYLSYLALVSVAANLLLGRTSDRLGKRVAFLYPITLTLAISTLLLPVATHEFTFWLIFTGIIQFFLPLFRSLTISLFIDIQEDLTIALPGRELTLAVGRVLGATLTVISFALEPTPRIVCFIFAGALFLYVGVLHWNRAISKQFIYR